MSDVLRLLNIVLPGAYIGVFALYLRHFLGEQEGSVFVGSRILYGVLALHAAYLVLFGIQTAHFPIATHSEFFSLLALSVGVTYGIAERWHRETHTGTFFLAIVFLFQLFSAMFAGDPSTIPDRSRNPIYGTHVVATVFGFAGLTVSSLYALMYIMLSHQLKSRNLGLIFQRLPSLSTLEKMSKLAVSTGVVLLGVGLALGHYVAYAEFGLINPMRNPTILVADIAWLAYLVGLVVARVRGLSGIRMGYLSLFGYLAFMASMAIVLTQFGAFHTFQ